MTLIARLCALCAVGALMQLVMGEADERGSIRMISGLLMLHLVISGAHELAQRLAGERELMRIFEILVQ